MEPEDAHFWKCTYNMIEFVCRSGVQTAVAAEMDSARLTVVCRTEGEDWCGCHWLEGACCICEEAVRGMPSVLGAKTNNLSRACTVLCRRLRCGKAARARGLGGYLRVCEVCVGGFSVQQGLQPWWRQLGAKTILRGRYENDGAAFWGCFEAFGTCPFVLHDTAVWTRVPGADNGI